MSSARPPLVLMYHAIIPRQPGWRNVDLDAMYQDDFDRQLKALKRGFEVMHPEEWADFIARDRPLPRRSALVTIDDGFQNLVDHAIPVAGAMNVVPLAFVCTGHLDGGGWIWFARTCASRLLGGPDLRGLFGRLGTMRLEEIETLLTEKGAPTRDQGSATCHLLFDGADGAALARCASKGSVCLGGHTERHPNLSRESIDTCRREIVDNKRALERIAGAPVRLFAYPSGDLSGAVARCVRDAGYDGAFSILPPAASFPGDLARYHIPRTGIYSPGRLRFWLKCAGVDYWRWRAGLLR